jgi:hypothetical protein
VTPRWVDSLRARRERPRRGQLAPGAAAAQVVNVVEAEVAGRRLGDRERQRIKAFEEVAIPLVEERLARGEKPRADDYFTPPRSVGARLEAPWGYPQPPAYEIVEAGLMNAGQSNEERKIPYLASLTVALIFEGSPSPAYCHQLQQLAQRLSYRQLVCIAVFGRGYRDEAIRADDHFAEDHGIVMELDGLARDGLLGTSNPDRPADPTDHLREVGLAYVSTTAAGNTLHDFMGLERVSDDDRAEVVRQLGATGS